MKIIKTKTNKLETHQLVIYECTHTKEYYIYQTELITESSIHLKTIPYTDMYYKGDRGSALAIAKGYIESVALLDYVYEGEENSEWN